MKKFIRAIGRTLVALAVIFGIAWIVVALLRWQAFDDADRAAIALMDAASPAPAGSNGYAALMLADFDAPAGAEDAALAADIARFERHLADNAKPGGFWTATEYGQVEALDPGYTPFADVDWPRRPPPPGADAPLCAMGKPGCLAQVQAAPEPVRALLQEHAGRLASIERALAADHLYNTYPETISTPLPPYSSLRLALTAAALDAVDGHAPEAVARTCRLLAATRRTDREGRNLIEKMVAQSLAEGSAHLLLDLRRAHPQAALPADCTPALAPVDTDEAAVCPALRGEYRMYRTVFAQLDIRLGGWRPDALLTRALLFDEDLQAAWAAETFVPYCTDDARELAARGEPPAVPEVLPVDYDDLDCYASFIGCTLAQVATPAVGGFAGRALDHAAKLRLLLAAQAVVDGRSDAATAAAAAANAGYPVAFDPATQRATIQLKHARGDEEAAFAVDFAGLAPVAPVAATD